MLTYLAAWNLNRGFEPVRHAGSSHQTLVPVQTASNRRQLGIPSAAKKNSGNCCVKPLTIHRWQKIRDAAVSPRACRTANT